MTFIDRDAFDILCVTLDNTLNIQDIGVHKPVCGYMSNRKCFGMFYFKWKQPFKLSPGGNICLLSHYALFIIHFEFLVALGKSRAAD